MSKYFNNQNDVPEWWTEQDDIDVETALNATPMKFTPDTDPEGMDESLLDDEEAIRPGFYRLYDSINGEYVSERIFSRSEAETYLMTYKGVEQIKYGEHYMIGSDDTDIIELSDIAK